MGKLKKYLLTASNDANSTCPGTMAKKALPAWDFITGPIIDPEATPTMSSMDLLSFSVIFDIFLTLNHSLRISQPRAYSITFSLKDRNIKIH